MALVRLGLLLQEARRRHGGVVGAAFGSTGGVPGTATHLGGVLGTATGRAAGEAGAGCAGGAQAGSARTSMGWRSGARTSGGPFGEGCGSPLPALALPATMPSSVATSWKKASIAGRAGAGWLQLGLAKAARAKMVRDRVHLHLTGPMRFNRNM